MAELPANNTARWYIDYSTSLSEHTLMLRSTAATGSPAVVAVVSSLFTALNSVLSLHTINRIRYSAQGQDYSIPVPSTLDGDTFGTGGATTLGDAGYLNFVGRSIDGRRVKAAVFGITLAIPSDFRLTSGESAPVLNAVAALNSNPDVALAISGADTTWYPYANVGINSYWQKEHRS